MPVDVDLRHPIHQKEKTDDSFLKGRAYNLLLQEKHKLPIKFINGHPYQQSEKSYISMRQRRKESCGHGQKKKETGTQTIGV